MAMQRRRSSAGQVTGDSDTWPKKRKSMALLSVTGSLQLSGSLRNLTVPSPLPSASSIRDLDLDPELAPWFVAGLDRESVRTMARRIRDEGKPGQFMIRDSQNEPNCYAMTVNDGPGSIATYVIERQGSVVQLRGAKETFPGISALVAFYSAELRPSLGIQLVASDMDDAQFGFPP